MWSNSSDAKELVKTHNEQPETEVIRTPLGQPSAKLMRNFRASNDLIQNESTFAFGRDGELQNNHILPSVEQSLIGVRRSMSAIDGNDAQIFGEVENEFAYMGRRFGHIYNPDGLPSAKIGNRASVIAEMAKLKETGMLSTERNSSIIRLRQKSRSLAAGEGQFKEETIAKAKTDYTPQIKSHRNWAWGWAIAGVAVTAGAAGAYLKR